MRRGRGARSGTGLGGLGSGSGSGLGLGLVLGLVLGLGVFGPACTQDPGSEVRATEAGSRTPAKAKAEEADDARSGGEGADGEAFEDGEEFEDGDDALSGEAAHVIPFADRTSMGYLLLLPASEERPEAPTRAFLAGLVEQSFPDRRHDGEIDLLLTLIATEPHTTDAGTLMAPSLDGEFDSDTGELGDAGELGIPPIDPKRERARIFDLIGLHIEVLRLGVGRDALISSEVYADPVLTRALSQAQRDSLPGRGWALLLRADYRNQHGVRGLRLHQTLVRLVAAHKNALIHDPDTLEIFDVEAFDNRKLRALAGNVADQIAIVPFPDPDRDGGLRLATRGMRRFGVVDLELVGLDPDPEMLQQASDLIAGLALSLVEQAEVDSSGFAVEVPETVEVTRADIENSYAGARKLAECTECSALRVHLVERPPEAHDPRDHVVARIVAPRLVSDASDYDHPQWVRTSLVRLFTATGADPTEVGMGAPVGNKTSL